MLKNQPLLRGRNAVMERFEVAKGAATKIVGISPHPSATSLLFIHTYVLIYMIYHGACINTNIMAPVLIAFMAPLANMTWNTAVCVFAKSVWLCAFPARERERECVCVPHAWLHLCPVCVCVCVCVSLRAPLTRNGHAHLNPNPSTKPKTLNGHTR